MEQATPNWAPLAPYFDKVEHFYNTGVAGNPTAAALVKVSTDALRQRLEAQGIDTSDDGTLFVIASAAMEFAALLVTELESGCAGEPKAHAMVHVGNAATGFGYLLRGLRLTREQIEGEEAFLAHVQAILDSNRGAA